MESLDTDLKENGRLFIIENDKSNRFPEMLTETLTCDGYTGRRGNRGKQEMRRKRTILFGA